jgi:hypothetical protein
VDGLFLVALGVVALLIGLINAFPLRRLDPRFPESTGVFRGRELGGYAIMALGAILVAIGLVAVVVEWLS